VIAWGKRCLIGVDKSLNLKKNPFPQTVDFINDSWKTPINNIFLINTAEECQM